MKRFSPSFVAPLLLVGLVSLAFRPADAATATLSREVEALRAPSAVNHQGFIDQAMASPAVADVTGDGVPDAVVAGMDGTITVFDIRTGQQLRHVTVHSGSMIQGAPTLKDVTGDGVPDVAVGTTVLRGGPGASRVRIYDMTSSPRLVFDATDHMATPAHGFFGSPAIGDIDGDGQLEVVATSLAHHLYAWELSGAPVAGFPVHTYDTTLSSPALADVDADGVDDIIFGADMDTVQPLPHGGYLWVVRGDGAVFPGYPLRLGTEVLWSSPAVADIDGDGDLDAVIGTGRFFNQGDERKLYAVDLLNRTAVAGWPRTLSANTTSSPALAQLAGDERPEIVTMTADGILHVLRPDGTLVWKACARPAWDSCAADSAILASPVVADVDSDPEPEVVVAVNRELLVFSASGTEEFRGTIRSNQGDFAWPSANAPAVARVGSSTAVVVSAQIDNGDHARRDGDQQGLYVWFAAAAPASLPWAQFQRGAAHRGSIAVRVDTSAFDGYVGAVYQDLLGRAATSTEQQHWGTKLVRSGGSHQARTEFTRALSRSPEWTGHVMDTLYQQVFGREPDPGGRAYWSDLMAKGMRVSEVAALFYGSDEWFHRAPPTGGGGTIDGFVDNLYRRVLRREPDSQSAFWKNEVRRGVHRTAVSGAFYLSYESNSLRVEDQYQDLLGRSAEPAGRDYWARQFATIDDIELTALLTASDEYLQRNR